MIISNLKFDTFTTMTKYTRKVDAAARAAERVPRFFINIFITYLILVSTIIINSCVCDNFSTYCVYMYSQYDCTLLISNYWQTLHFN